MEIVVYARLIVFRDAQRDVTYKVFNDYDSTIELSGYDANFIYRTFNDKARNAEAWAKRHGFTVILTVLDKQHINVNMPALFADGEKALYYNNMECKIISFNSDTRVYTTSNPFTGEGEYTIAERDLKPIRGVAVIR